MAKSRGSTYDRIGPSVSQRIRTFVFADHLKKEGKGCRPHIHHPVSAFPTRRSEVFIICQWVTLLRGSPETFKGDAARFQVRSTGTAFLNRLLRVPGSSRGAPTK